MEEVMYSVYINVNGTQQWYNWEDGQEERLIDDEEKALKFFWIDDHEATKTMTNIRKKFHQHKLGIWGFKKYGNNQWNDDVPNFLEEEWENA